MLNTEKVTRIEIIDETGRAYVRYLKYNETLQIDEQDEGRTIKIFIRREGE